MKKDLYQVPSHRYDFAGFMNKLGGNPVDGKLTTGAFAGMNADLAGALPVLGSAVGGVAGGLIGGGRTSAAGDVIGGLSKMASAIPGPWGAIAGAGLGVIGGLTNAAFGVKLNQENINAVNNNIATMNSFQSNAEDYDSLAQNFLSQPTAMHFDRKFIGKNGWFNNGATKKFNELQGKQAFAQQFVSNSLENNRNNIATKQAQNLLANYAAYGGPLGMITGPIDYSMAMQYLDMKNNENKDTVLARGGRLHTHGSDWDTGINYIGNGGSHESNPFDGVQVGIAPDGQPNLVEEGEVIWNNDYVFSKRLKVPKAVRTKYKLRGTKPMSFAEAVMQVNKEVEERPNDPISKRGRDSMLAKLADVQEEKRADIALKEQQEDMLQGIQPMIAANGGAIHIDKNKRGTFTAAASRHGKSVQEFASQVLANPENYSPAMRKKANFARNAAKWHGGGGHLFLPGGNLTWPYPYREDDDRYDGRVLPWTVNLTSKDWLNKFNDIYDVSSPYNYHELPETTIEKLRDTDIKRGVEYSLIPSAATYINTNVPRLTLDDSAIIQGVTRPSNAIQIQSKPNPNNRSNNSSWLTGLRYAPVVGSALGVFGDLLGITNRPDYSSADAILEASKGIRDVSFRPIGDYMTYNPFDRMFYLNQLNANAGASRRALINQSAGNRGTAIAGILASDNNMMNSIGQIARQAEEYNLAQRQKVADFNRATNMFNSEGFLKAQQANQGASEVRMRAAQAAAALRDAIDQRVGAARSINLTNLFESLGDIGREEAVKDMIRGNRGLLYDWLGNYKGILGANGGKLVIKNKKRRR